MIWGAEWWEAAQAIGTTGAVLVALGLAGWEAHRHRQTQDELESMRDSESEAHEFNQASLVSAWVEMTYTPSRNGSHYESVAHVYISNESNEPVFDVHLTVGVGEPAVQIGPLSAPIPIPVFPPRRTRHWDISVPLMAHRPSVGNMPTEPVAQLSFSTAKGKRWRRKFSGQLQESSGEVATYLDEDSEGEKQLGDLDNPYNPMQAALAFFSAATSDPPPSYRTVEHLLAPTATAWSNLKRTWPEICAMVKGYGLAAHVAYPAPRIAYVKLVHEEDSKKEISRSGFISVRALIATLVFIPNLGWRVFSIGAGATGPDWVPFPVGSLNEEVKGDPDS